MSTRFIKLVLFVQFSSFICCNAVYTQGNSELNNYNRFSTFWIPDQRPFPVPEYYDDHIQFLNQINRDTLKFIDVDLFHNLAAQYKKIEAPKDTVFKYLNMSVNFFPHNECFTLFQASWKEMIAGFFSEVDSLEWASISTKCNSIFNQYDTKLASELEEMLILDQKIRGDRESKDHNLLMAKQIEIDKTLRLRLDSIILRNGNKYPGKSLVGSQLADVAFLFVQHGDYAYQKKYLEVIEKAVESHDLDKSNLALLYDRIMLTEKKEQYYGTQFFYNETSKRNEFFKIRDAENVDMRRYDFGLFPLKTYAQIINRK